MAEQYIIPKPAGSGSSNVDENLSSSYFTAIPPGPPSPDPNFEIIITGVGTYRGLDAIYDYDFRSIIHAEHTGVGTALYATGTSAIVAVGDTSGLIVSGDSAIHATGNVSLGNGTITVGRSASDDVEVLGEFTSNLIPNATNTYDLGSSSRRWDDVFALKTTTGTLTVDNNASIGGIGTFSNWISVAGIIGASGLNATGIVTANAFSGVHASLSGIVTANAFSGVHASLSGIVTANAFSGVHASLSGIVTATTFIGSGANITGVVTATTFIGSGANITGVVTASSFSGAATQVQTTSTATNASFYPTFVDSNNGVATGETIYTDAGITYNPSSNTLTASTFSGSLNGNASTATTLQTARDINGVSFNGSSNITVEPYIDNDESTNASRYITFVDNSTAGYKRLSEDSSLTYNPSSNTLTAGFFSGDGSGLTNVSGSSASTIPVTSTSDSTCWVVLVGGTAGNQSPLYDTGLTYNASSNTLSCTTFNGSLSGNASTASQVGVQSNSTNATFYPTFVDSNNVGSIAETVYTDDGITYNPSSNTLTASTFIGNFSTNGSGPVQIRVENSNLVFEVAGIGTHTLLLA